MTLIRLSSPSTEDVGEALDRLDANGVIAYREWRVTIAATSTMTAQSKRSAARGEKTLWLEGPNGALTLVEGRRSAQVKAIVARMGTPSDSIHKRAKEARRNTR